MKDRPEEREQPKPISYVTDAPFELPFWLISDTHFFHRNIIDYCGRPENHEDLMIDNWIDKVGEHDLLIHLGDLALGKPERIKELAPELPGRKFIVLGNHDRRSKPFYYHELGFKPIKPFVLEWQGWMCLFSHQPDYAHSFVSYPKRLNVHGHIHEKVLEDRRFLNVSVEQTDYSPVWVSDLIDERIAELSSGTAPALSESR